MPFDLNNPRNFTPLLSVLLLIHKPSLLLETY